MDDGLRQLSLEPGADLCRRRRRILLAESRRILRQLHPGSEDCVGSGSAGGRGGIGSEVHRGEEGERVERSELYWKVAAKTGVQEGWGLRFFEVNNILIVGSKDAVHLEISKHIINPS